MTMANKEDLKKNIYDYLLNKSGPTPNVIDLTIEGIQENFHKHSKKEIKDALKELEREDSISSHDIHFRIHMPEENIENIQKEYRRFFIMPFLLTLFFGYIIILVVVSIFKNSILQKIPTLSSDTLLSILILIFVGALLSYFVGIQTIKFLSLIKNKYPLLRQYGDYYIPSLIVVFLGGSIYSIYLFFTDANVDIVPILMIFGFSVAAQVSWVIFKLKNKDNNS